jgi:hypothetical protein
MRTLTGELSLHVNTESEQTRSLHLRHLQQHKTAKLEAKCRRNVKRQLPYVYTQMLPEKTESYGNIQNIHE